MQVDFSHALKTAGEYEKVRAPTILWISYISSVCGCILAVALKGLFGISIASGSSVISDIAILMASKEDRFVGFNEIALLAITLFSGLGSFFTGALLFSTAGGKSAFISILFPSSKSWTWQHQLHVSVCMCCLAISHALVEKEIDPKLFDSDLRKSYLAVLVTNSTAYVFSVFLLSFSMSAVSALLTLNSALNMRGGNFTSQVFDSFAGLGFAARARDCRYLWKSHMLFWSVAGFTAGCCIGANAIEQTFKTYSVTVPIIMLAPLWFFGAKLLIERRLSRKSRFNRLQELLVEESPDNSVSTKVGEYEVLDLRQFMWIAYVCFVAGSTNAISRMGIFARPSTHITGLVARMAMGIQYPPPRSARGVSTYSFEEYLLAVFAFGLGGFVSGFVLTVGRQESLDNRVYSIKMNFPSAAHWRPCHQLLLTLSIVSYGVANALFQSTSNGDKNFVRRPYSVVDIEDSPAFVTAWVFNVFGSGLLNGLLCTGAQITLRAGNMDGHVLDLFMGLADAIRSRSLRSIWRVRAQSLAILAFFSGCLIGTVLFDSEYGVSALSFACILLSPMWLLGIYLLYLRRQKHSVEPPEPRDMRLEYSDSDGFLFPGIDISAPRKPSRPSESMQTLRAQA